MGGSIDASHNRAPDQLSLTMSFLIIGAAGALNFLIAAPAASSKEERPFGESQSGQERMQTQLRRRGNVAEADARPLRLRFRGKDGKISFGEP
jgi:hypothetical protein